MSVLFYDSVGNYNSFTSSDIYDTVGWLNFISGSGRGGRNCLENNTLAGNVWPDTRKTGTLANTVTGYLGFAMNLGTGSSASGWVWVCGFTDASTTQCGLQWNTTTGLFRLVQGTTPTVLGTSSTGFMPGSGFHYIELGATINNSTGYIEVHLDGVSLLNLTNQNTRTSSNNYFNGFAFGQISNINQYICDIYLVDNNGSSPLNGFLGDVVVLYSPPAADGGTNQFTSPAAAWVATTAYTVGQFVIDGNGNLQRCTTAGTSGGSAPSPWHTSSTTTDNTVTWTFWSTGSGHFNFIKESSPDDATSYLSDNTVGHQELYTVTALSGVPAGVTSALAVCIDVRGQRDQTSARGIRTVSSSSGVAADNGTDLLLQNGVWGSFKTAFANDPNTSGPWTVTSINASKIGSKVSL